MSGSIVHIELMKSMGLLFECFQPVGKIVTHKKRVQMLFEFFTPCIMLTADIASLKVLFIRFFHLPVGSGVFCLFNGMLGISGQTAS